MGSDGGEQTTRDPLRLLAQRSEHGYVDRVDRALRDEPEAVAADVQREQTRAAHARERQRLRAAWTPVVLALDEFLALGAAVPRDVAHRARGVARTAKLIDSQIAQR